MSKNISPFIIPAKKLGLTLASPFNIDEDETEFQPAKWENFFKYDKDDPFIIYPLVNRVLENILMFEGKV